MKKLILAALAVMLAAAFAGAEEPAKSRMTSLMQYFKHLKQGLTQSAVQGRYQKGRAAAVAAVRGTGQEDAKSDPNRPQMMQPGRSKKSKEEAKEKAEFEKAVDLIVEGKSPEGAAALDAFEKAHPKSRLLEQVREAKAKASELAGASAEEEAPEKEALP